MTETSGAQERTGQSGADQGTRVPLTARLLLHQSLTARRAAAIIAAVLMLTAIARLARIEAALTPARSGGSSDGID